jgi:hypothetical protein
VTELKLALNDNSSAGGRIAGWHRRQIHGELAAVLALSDPKTQKLPAAGAIGSQLSVVAGERPD